MKKLRTLDLFSGAGGLSLGARQAGCQIVGAIEADYWAAQTYQSNFAHARVINSRVEKIDPSTFSSSGIQMLIGGPPCRAFSTSNQRNRGSHHPDAKLYLEFIRFARALTPEVMILENVPGLLQTEGARFYRAIIRSFEELGYQTYTLDLDSTDFGVPQRRRRLFVVGTREIIPNLKLRKHRYQIPVKDAIGDLPILRNGSQCKPKAYRKMPDNSYAKTLRGKRTTCGGHLVTKSSEVLVERFRHVPPGGNWEDIPEELWPKLPRERNWHTGLYHRLKSNEPSAVVGNYRKNLLLHPTQNRGLSVREAARIQSFPDWFEFRGSIGFQQQQVANAVPPKLAKRVIAHFLKHLAPQYDLS